MNYIVKIIAALSFVFVVFMSFIIYIAEQAEVGIAKAEAATRDEIEVCDRYMKRAADHGAGISDPSVGWATLAQACYTRLLVLK